MTKVQCSPLVTLCLGSIGMKHVIKGNFTKEFIGK